MTRVMDYLRAARSPDERRDREVLLAHVLGCDRGRLYAHPESIVDEAHIGPLLERHARAEPVAYLTGRREFWSLDLAVTRDVLIPRPETELLVELVLAYLPECGSVLDLGTGSGAIALAVASGRPRAHIVANDVSLAALAVARENAARLGFDVRFVHSDWYAAIVGSFDVVVANPPYVAADDPHLDALVFEPRDALVAGADGLDSLRRVIGGASEHLAEGGWLIVEHGHEQGDAVRSLFRDQGFRGIESRRDLAGCERATLGHR
jgi:release factor glutamine methyltransferase